MGKSLSPQPHHPDPALPFIHGVECQGDGCGRTHAEGHGGEKAHRKAQLWGPNGQHLGGKGRRWRKNSGHTAACRSVTFLGGCTSPLGILLTGLRAAAGVRAARAADVAAAAMRAALTPADPHQDEDEQDPQDHQADKHPLWKDAQRNARSRRPPSGRPPSSVSPWEGA